jgi:hypothetical protein
MKEALPERPQPADARASYREAMFVLAVSGPLLMGVVIAGAVVFVAVLLKEESRVPEDEEPEER